MSAGSLELPGTNVVAEDDEKVHLMLSESARGSGQPVPIPAIDFLRASLWAAEERPAALAARARCGTCTVRRGSTTFIGRGGPRRQDVPASEIAGTSAGVPDRPARMERR